MKTNSRKLFYYLLITTLISLNACTKMNMQTEQIIDHNRTILHEKLKTLETENLITPSESAILSERINLNYDYYLQHPDINLEELKKMFFDSVKSLENIRFNQEKFLILSSSFHAITGQISVRNLPNPIKQEDYVIQQQLNKVMNDWFDKYQTEDEKLEDVISSVDNVKKKKIYPSISSDEYDDIIATLNTIKQNKKLSKEDIKNILLEKMQKFCNKDEYANLNLLNIFSGVSRIKNIGIENELDTIYKANQKPIKEPDYSELKMQMTARFNFLLSEGMISQPDYNLYNNIISSDIDFCQNTSDKNLVKNQLLKNLGKLKDADLDTEDREAIVETYFLLAKKKEIDIKKELNIWLYNSDF